MNQTTIFDMLYPNYKIKKPIRIIELFAGYGSQSLALKYLGVNFEHWKICEWAIKSIQAYKDIHFTDNKLDIDMTKEQMIEYLYNLGISSNYNDPMSKEQISRLSEDKLKTIVENIQITHNLVNIQQAKGKDLDIKETNKYDYLLTYSFPCQDLSLAGLKKGMSDTSTRSGMLWEVERILTECKQLGTLPQILLMENVPQVHGVENVEDFNKWQLRLEELGYKNYWQDLIATDYEIPQTRNRCFMISILGDYNFVFPKPIPLKLKLKDMLEDNVDESYYLSDKMLNYCMSTNQTGKWDRSKIFLNNLDQDVASTITTKAGNRATDNFVKENVPKLLGGIGEKNSNNGTQWYQQNRIYDSENVSICLSTIESFQPNYAIKVKNATKQGYLEATEGDGINISSRMEYQRGNVQKDKIQTLTTQCDRGVVIGTYQFSKSDKFMQGKDRFQEGKETSDTLQTNPKEAIVNSDLRIRKLTPKECFRLMGVKDEDYENCAKNQSNASLYHLAGDSIVVNVLMAIFSQLFEKEN